MLDENPCGESASRVPCDNRSIEGVREGYSVHGVCDVVAKVEANSMDELKDIVTFKIRRLSMVGATSTMIVIKWTEPYRSQVSLSSYQKIVMAFEPCHS